MMIGLFCYTHKKTTLPITQLDCYFLIIYYLLGKFYNSSKIVLGVTN